MLKRILPFLYLGIMIVLFAIGLIIFSYILICGAIVGLILFFIAWVKEKFFPNQSTALYKKSQQQGRTIEHDDQNK